MCFGVGHSHGGGRVGDVAMESLGEAVQCLCSLEGALLALPYAQGPGQCELLKDRACSIPLPWRGRSKQRNGL